MYKFIATNNNNYKYIPEDNTRNSYNYIMKELEMKESKFKVGDIVKPNWSSSQNFIIKNVKKDDEIKCFIYFDDVGYSYEEHLLELVKPSESKEDKPKHYQTNSIDVIDLCNEYNINFNLGNVIKYCCRAGKKENESTLKDLKKAKDYLDRQIKYLENK